MHPDVTATPSPCGCAARSPLRIRRRRRRIRSSPSKTPAALPAARRRLAHRHHHIRSPVLWREGSRLRRRLEFASRQCTPTRRLRRHGAAPPHAVLYASVGDADGYVRVLPRHRRHCLRLAAASRTGTTTSAPPCFGERDQGCAGGSHSPLANAPRRDGYAVTVRLRRTQSSTHPSATPTDTFESFQDTGGIACGSPPPRAQAPPHPLPRALEKGLKAAPHERRKRRKTLVGENADWGWGTAPSGNGLDRW